LRGTIPFVKEFEGKKKRHYQYQKSKEGQTAGPTSILRDEDGKNM
jgi:hypothetical protein